MRALRQFLTLTALTAAEAMRQPIFLLLTVTCVVLTALVPVLNLHNFGEDGKLARDGGLAFQFVFGLFVAAYASCSSLSREIRSGTIAGVLSKPVSRDMLFLAKYAGLACVIAGFSACAMVSTLLSHRVAEQFVFTMRMVAYVTDWQTARLLLAAPFAALLAAAWLNYRLRRPFESTALALLLLALLAVLFLSGGFDRLGHWAPFDCRVAWRLLPAGLLVLLGLLVLGAFGLSLATRLDLVPTMTACAGVFVAGHLSQPLFGHAAGTATLAGWLHRLLPDWQMFWAADALNHGGTIPATHVHAALGYAALYAAAVLCAGLASFRGAELNP